MRVHPVHGKPDIFYQMLVSRHPLNIAFHRAALEGGSVFLGVPEGSSLQNVCVGGRRSLWINGHEDEAGRTILFLHGGGYMVGSLRTHRSLAAYLAKMAKARALLVHYRRSPEHPFPAALEDAYLAYMSLIKDGVAPEKIAIAGDSAGGGLSLALLLAIKQTGQPLPSCAYLMSPWVDLADSDLRFPVPPTNRTDLADWFTDFMADMYVADYDPTHPFISPLHGDLRGLPPIFMHMGKYEPLRRQGDLLAERARNAGVDLTYQYYRSPIHVIQALAPFSGRVRHLLAKGGAFIRGRCSVVL